MSTWVALLKLLNEVGVKPEQCFFTNAYMGLRVGEGTTGRFPGSRDRGFVERCQEFFLRQLATQNPRVVMALGAWVPRFLAPLASELDVWKKAKTLNEIDRIGALQHGVRFDGAAQRCSVVVLTHPSLRGPNVRRRWFGDLTGHRAELAMVRKALAESGFLPSTLR